MKILSRLERVKNVSKLKSKFFVFDCETFFRDARPESFALCCLYGEDYRKYFRTIQEFKDEVFSGRFNKCYIFCHWGEFDLNVIFSNIIMELDNEAIFNGSRFIMAKVDGVTFADSTNIYPHTTVKTLGQLIGVPKLDMDDRFGKGKVFPISHNDIIYCMRDCEIVWKALDRIFTEVQSVRATLAALAMIYFRRFYQKYHLAYNELARRFFESYTGGRVEMFRKGKVNSHIYDINSMYPYVMSRGYFPNPKFIKVSSSRDVQGLVHDMKYYEGQATVTVVHKKVNFGHLPLKRNGKLEFPTGTFTGTWCFPELRYALKKKVIEVISVKEVLISKRMFTPFKAFVEVLYARRIKETGISKTITKLCLNSLYGKFAQREKHRDIYFESIPWEIIENLKKYRVPYELKTFNEQRNDCYLIIFNPIKVVPIKVQGGGFRLTYSNGAEVNITEYSIYTKKELQNFQDKPKIHTIPVFSTYITSNARVHLLQFMEKYKHLGITYVDTDSIFFERKPNIKDSTTLGAFKLEKGKIQHLHGNKNYLKMEDGVKERKIKGIPKKARKIGRNRYEFENIIKTKKAIRHGREAGIWETFQKELTGIYDKRQVFKGGKTKPNHYHLRKVNELTGELMKHQLMKSPKNYERTFKILLLNEFRK